MASSLGSVSGSVGAGSTATASAAPPAANIRVYVRVRPLSQRELEGGGQAQCLAVTSPRSITFGAQNGGGVRATGASAERSFSFDHVAASSAAQSDVFEKVGRPITDACMRGYNGTIIAYGQTGSGKTHTISGGDSSDSRGLMPRVFEYLMASIAREEKVQASAGISVTYTVTASSLEIYNEKIFDLLSSSSQQSGVASLQLREDTRRGVFVEGLTEEPIRSSADCADLMSRGAAARRVGETALNRESSRSHSVFTLRIRSSATANGRTVEKTARFSLIDLAGSERAKDTGATGVRMDEAKNINRSLSALGNVIRELNKRGQAVTSNDQPPTHVSYRDSRLTHLLRDSLGGNSLTFLVACVSSSGSSCFETLSTLKFATMASAVRNCAKVNEDASASLEALREENKRLQQAVERMMQHQASMGARRLSMMPMMPSASSSHHPRDSMATGGLLTPERLRKTGTVVAEGEEESDATEGANFKLQLLGASASQLRDLFAQSHAREQAWAEELDAHRSQLEIMEAKQRHDGLLMRLKDAQLAASARSSSVNNEDADQQLAQENESLRAQIEAMREHALDVTHAPSLLEARRQITVLRDLLERSGVSAEAGEDSPDSTTAIPKHRRDFALQTHLLALQEQVATLTLEAEEAGERGVEAALAEFVTRAQEREEKHTADLASEREMAQHLESQLEHALSTAEQQAREAAEAYLLQSGCRARVEAERDSLRDELSSVRDKASHELREAAASHQAEAGVSERLLGEVQALQARLDTALAAVKDKDEALFQAAQAQAIQAMQREDDRVDLATARTKSAAHEAAAKQATEQVALLQSQVNTFTIELVSVNTKALNTTAELATTKERVTEWTAKYADLETKHQRTIFALDTLQDDHDTLDGQFAFQEAALAEAATKLSEAKTEAMAELTAAKTEAAATIEAIKFEAATTVEALKIEASVSAEAAALKLRQTTERVQELEATLCERDVSIEAVRSEMASLRAHNEEAIIQITQLEKTATSAEIQSTNLALKHDQITTELASVRIELHEASRVRSESQSAYQTLSETHGQKVAEIETLQKAKNEANAKIDQQRLKLEAAATELTRVQTSLDQSISEVSRMREEVLTLTTEKDALSTRVLEVSNELEKVSAEVTELTHEHEALTAQMKAVLSERTTLSAQLAVVTDEKVQLENKLLTTENEHTEVIARVTALEDEKEALHIQLIAESTEKVMLTTQLTTASEEKATLVTQLTAASNEHAALVAQLDVVLSEKDTLTIQLDAATVEKTSLTSQLTALALEKDEAAAQMRQIMDMAASLNSEDAARAARVAEEEAASAAALREENETLRKQIETKQQHADQIQAEVTSRDSQLANAAIELKRVSSERESLVSSTASLERSLSDVRAQLATALASPPVQDDSALVTSLQSELAALQERWSEALSERSAWLQEMESCRREEARVITASAEVRSQLALRDEALATVNKEAAALRKANAALEHTNTELAGHQNLNQKINLHQTIKRENDQLRVQKQALERDVTKFRRLFLQNAAGTGAPGAATATTTASSASALAAGLDKQLAAADEHLRAGEQAQVQLQALMERVADIDLKVRTAAAAATAADPTILGDVTNQSSSLSEVASTTKTASPASSFPACLSSLSALSASLTRLTAVAEQSRRDAGIARGQARLQAMKQDLAAQQKAQQLQAQALPSFESLAQVASQQ